MPEPFLRVAHLIDQPTGGAAVAANRLVQGLAKNQEFHLERWSFGKNRDSLSGIECYPLERRFPKTVLERLVRIPSKKCARFLQRNRQRRALLSTVAERKPDILHLHNLHASALNHDDLALLPNSVRLVWTMHDCWPVAPWAYRWKNIDGTYHFQGKEKRPEKEALGARKRFFAKRNGMFLVSPSRWLRSEALISIREGIPIRRIPYGVSENCASSIPKNASKTFFGLDPAKIWIGLSASSFDCRKGADIIASALGLLNRSDIGIVLWGKYEEINLPGHVSRFFAGYVSDEHRQGQLYSACDLFVCPSRIDNLPNTVLESMACGTPVVASDCGGIPDMVTPSETGWLFQPSSPESCMESLNKAFCSREAWYDYGLRCRKKIKELFSLERQANSYSDTYKELMGHEVRTRISRQ
ncbi:MAG: glycosyltransferase [Verrucomicrobia bacterium]|nr:glycosyltransferase [Verrucomicrobiota bacterium]